MSDFLRGRVLLATTLFLGTIGLLSAVIYATLAIGTPDFAGAFAALALLVAACLVKSVHQVPTNKILASFFLGDYDNSYASASAIAARNPTGTEYDAHRAWFGSFVFLLWPFWRVTLVPGTVEVIRYRSPLVYLEKNGDSSFPVNVDATIVMQLGFNLRKFFSVFDMAGYGDLTVDREVNYVVNRTTEEGAPQFQKYNADLFTEFFSRATSTTVRETLREVISKHTWDKLRGGLRSIEQKIRISLSAHESSFVTGGLLVEATGEPGECLYRIDINLEDPIPANTDLQKAQSAAAIAQHNAEAKRKEGEGERDRIKAIAETGVNAKEVLSLEALKSSKELNVFATDGSLTDMVAGLIAGRRGRRP